MTEQQTAVTDNALVEKLESFVSATDGNLTMMRSVTAPLITEAAERIKSLLAEVERLKEEKLRDLRASLNPGPFDIAALQADRQRMRDALAAIRGYSEDNGMTRRKMRTIARTALETAEALANRMGATFEPAALNPASKEANDG